MQTFVSGWNFLTSCFLEFKALLVKMQGKYNKAKEKIWVR